MKMKINSAIYIRILDILKNILGRAEDPSALSEYIIEQMRDLVDPKIIALVVHDENKPDHNHQILGFYPDRERDFLDMELMEAIFEASHEIHSTQIVYHNRDGMRIEQLLSSIKGRLSIIVPLEYSENRVGLMLLLDIPEEENYKNIIDPLNAISAVLALEFRNANLFQNLELTVASQTREVLESEKRFRTIIEQATDSMFLCDLNGNIVDVNQQSCTSLGFTREELLKLRIQDIDEQHNSIEKVLVYFKGNVNNQKKIFESVHRKKDGTTLPVEISTCIIELNGESYIIGFVRDITNRKVAAEKIIKLNEELERKVSERTQELQDKATELIENQKALLNLVEDINEKSEELTRKTEELQLSNKELDTYNYSISHDLRAPLRAVNGFIKILMNDYSDKFDHEGKRICKIIETNGVKMGKLIDDLLAFSRLGRSEIRRRNMDMNHHVKQIVDELNPNIAQRSINIKIEKLPKTICDPNLIRQVWINLISNALKYSSLKEETLIEIGSESTDNATIYFIKDNGIGFDMNYSHKLFGVFQRLHNRKEFEGTGVGLAIVQQIVQRHGGSVWAEGAIGQGAIFYFSLPKNFNHLN